jgi:hypothetical protein
MKVFVGVASHLGDRRAVFMLADLPTGKYVWERGVFKRAGVVMKELF